MGELDEQTREAIRQEVREATAENVPDAMMRGFQSLRESVTDSSGTAAGPDELTETVRELIDVIEALQAEVTDLQTQVAEYDGDDGDADDIRGIQ